MTTQVQDLETQETKEQDTEVQDGENTNPEEGETSEGTAAEGSEAESSEGDEQSEGGSDQEADKAEANKKSAQQRVSTRIRKLNHEKGQSDLDKQELQDRLNTANQRNEILQLAVNQNGADQKPVEPSPDDFEDGVQDPKYVKKFQEYLRDQNKEEIAKEVAKQTKTSQDVTSNNINQRDWTRKQKEHYLKAVDEGNDDYEEKEDALIEIIGKKGVEGIIRGCDDAHKIIYRLGADEKLAYDLCDALESNDQVLAVRLLERASGHSFKNKPKTKPTPDPDTQLPGGSPGAATGFEAKRLKMLEKAQKTGDQSIYSDFMDEHRAELKKEKAKYLPW